jgi:hypothetical protein
MSYGVRVVSYVKSARNLSNPRFNDIIRLAANYMKVSQPVDNEDVIEILDDEAEDICTNIVDNSSSRVMMDISAMGGFFAVLNFFHLTILIPCFPQFFVLLNFA